MMKGAFEEVILIATVVSRAHNCAGKKVSLRALVEKWPIPKWMGYLDFVLDTGIPQTVTGGLQLYKISLIASGTRTKTKCTDDT